MMGDNMTFPATFDEFAEKYKIVDSKEVYTNGTELVPIFRVKQWLEHGIVLNKEYYLKKIYELEKEREFLLGQVKAYECCVKGGAE
jgi:hypothetical protein